jgi:hypothetical protein
LSSTISPKGASVAAPLGSTHNMIERVANQLVMAAMMLMSGLLVTGVTSAAVPNAQAMVAADVLEPTPLGPWYEGTASFFGGPQVSVPAVLRQLSVASVLVL